MHSFSMDAHLAFRQVDIDTVEKFEALRETEKQYFLDMVKQCKDSGATLIICQWHALLLPPCLQSGITGPTAASSRATIPCDWGNPPCKVRAEVFWGASHNFNPLFFGMTGGLMTRQTTC